MQLKKLTSILAAALIITGCANVQQMTGMDDKTASTIGGASLGCLGGAALATAFGKDAAAGCAVGAVMGGLAGFEKARQEEIAAAEKARDEAQAVFATLPAKQQPNPAEVKTTQVEVTDTKTRETKKYEAFDSVTFDIPVSTRGTPEYEQAVGKLKKLAAQVANERGSSEIELAYAQSDVKKLKIKEEKVSVTTDKGKLITVSKLGRADVPKGVERYTVRAGKLTQSTM